MRVTERTPQTPRELEIFFRQTIEKIGGTESTLGDEEQKSSIPFNGMIQSLNRKVESLTRQGSVMRSYINRLESRISDIERQL